MIKTDVLQEMKIPAVFEPDQTLDCGQSFRWEKVGEKYGRESLLENGFPCEKSENPAVILYQAGT